jgi:hypothetical protein
MCAPIVEDDASFHRVSLSENYGNSFMFPVHYRHCGLFHICTKPTKSVIFMRNICEHHSKLQELAVFTEFWDTKKHLQGKNPFGGFLKWGYPKNSRFGMDNPITMDDYMVPPF